MVKRPRFPWLFLLGLLLGLAGGLVLAWVVFPVMYTDVSPANLNADDKNDYRSLIALAYLGNGDSGRAAARLALLGDADPIAALSAAVQGSGRSQSEQRALAALAADLYSNPSGVASSTPYAPGGSPTPEQQSTVQSTAYAQRATLTPLATFTPQPTRTPLPTLGAPFSLEDRQQVCDPNLQGQIQVEVRDAAGTPVSGVRIEVAWENGQDVFYTGLFLEKDAGYADYRMEPGIAYSLKAGEGGEVVDGLAAPECVADDGTTYPGGWYLLISQP